MSSVGSAITAPASPTQREESIIRGMVQAQVEMFQSEYRKIQDLCTKLTKGQKDDCKAGDSKGNDTESLAGLESACEAASWHYRALNERFEERYGHLPLLNMPLSDILSKIPTEKRNKLENTQVVLKDLIAVMDSWKAYLFAHDKYKEAHDQYTQLKNRLGQFEIQLGTDLLHNPDVKGIEAKVRRMQKRLGLGNPQKMQESRAAIAKLHDLFLAAENNANAIVDGEKDRSFIEHEMSSAQAFIEQEISSFRYIKDLLLKHPDLVYDGPRKIAVETYINLHRARGINRDNLKDLMMKKMHIIKQIKVEMKKLGIEASLNVAYIDQIPAKVESIWKNNIPKLNFWLNLAERVEKQLV